jgi:hypothetical protein
MYAALVWITLEALITKGTGTRTPTGHDSDDPYSGINN